MVVSDNVFYANPTTFNDPLDARPSLNTDVDVAKLEEILRIFVEQRHSAEMKAAAKTIKYRGPKTMEHIKRHSRRQAHELIAEIESYAWFSDYDSEDKVAPCQVS